MKEEEKTFIFENLVDGENDILGHIAYALYKLHKIEWIKNKLDETGKYPTIEEREEYRNICSSPKQIEAYKSMANVVLTNFINLVIEDFGEDIKEDYIKEQKDHIRIVLEEYQSEQDKHMKYVLKDYQAEQDGHVKGVLKDYQGEQNENVKGVLKDYQREQNDNVKGVLRDYQPEQNGHVKGVMRDYQGEQNDNVKGVLRDYQPEQNGHVKGVLRDYQGEQNDNVKNVVVKLIPSNARQHFWGVMQSVGGAVALALLIWLFTDVVTNYNIQRFIDHIKGNDENTELVKPAQNEKEEDKVMKIEIISPKEIEDKKTK